MDVRANVAVVGIAVIRGRIDRNGPALKRGNPPIRYSGIVKVFEAGGNFRMIGWRDGHRWIDAGTLQADIATETVRVLIQPIQTKCDFRSQWLIEIACYTLVSEPAALQ